MLAMKFAAINDSQYCEYRTQVIFQAYKWDPQFADQNTIAKHAILISKDTAQQLNQWAEQLSQETMRMEEALLYHLPLAKKLGLPSQIIKELPRLSQYKSKQNIRLMRFDFHPLVGNSWAVSEVNSDVPGGLAEAAILPEIASRYIDGCPGANVAEKLLEAFQLKTKKDSTVAFVHATSYSDDRQIMQFVGDYFCKHGLKAIYAAPDHLKWEKQQAFITSQGNKVEVDGIIRYFPLEWLVHLPKHSHWQGYYDSITPSCNHPIAIFAQSKRFPLIWDLLGVDIPTWKHLLPETCEPQNISHRDEGWIYKPALGRVGEGISIKEAITIKEMKQIQKAVHKKPENWIAQKRFNSMAISTANGEEYHLCMGVFTVDGKSAGFYGRISPYPCMDAKAMDIPVLIEQDS